jgi:hypothetical protein
VFFVPLALVICVCSIFALNITCSFVLLFFVAILAFLMNLRYLYVNDEEILYATYSVPFLFFNFILLILLLASGVFSYFFRVPA